MEIGRKRGVSVSAAGLGYLWSREVPVTALVGYSTMEQLRSSLEDCDYMPDPEDKAVYDRARWQSE
ncbi:hypothetical protein [Cohnella caldifontis]|uniref:hypothetical protein n=1 Tax=Cohnella caldifontis TaxID=3027471 RepID=UPI0023ED1AFE|nr:hypothetical protein [Cohnella sp. YIM B05605]